MLCFLFYNSDKITYYDALDIWDLRIQDEKVLFETQRCKE